MAEACQRASSYLFRVLLCRGSAGLRLAGKGASQPKVSVGGVRVGVLKREGVREPVFDDSEPHRRAGKGHLARRAVD